MFSGRIAKQYTGLQFRLRGGASPASGTVDPWWTATLNTARIQDVYDLQTGVSLEIDSYTLDESGSPSTTVILQIPDLGIDYTHEVSSSFMTSLDVQVQFTGVAIYVDSQPLFQFHVGAVALVVGGTTIQTFSGGIVPSTGLGPCYLPFIGVPPVITGAGGVVALGSSGSYYFGGGYQFIDSGGTARPFPCSINIPGAGGTVSPPSIAMTTTWDSVCTCDQTNTWIVGPSGPHHNSGEVKTTSQTAWYMVVPNLTQGIHKIAPANDYLALINRLDLPGYSWGGAYTLTTAGYTDGVTSPQSTTTTTYSGPTWWFPKRAGILDVVTSTAGDVEQPFSDFAAHASCPYWAEGGYANVSIANGRTVYSTTYNQGGDSGVSYFPSGTDNSGLNMNYLTWDYWDQADPAYPPAMVNMVNMCQTWFSLIWSFYLFFPNDGLTNTDPNAWTVDGTTEDPSTYWLGMRHQLMKNSWLSSGVNTGQLAQNVTEPLLTNGLGGFMQSMVAGQITSWWGVSRFQPLALSPAASKTLSAAGLWSVNSISGVPQASISVGGSSVTVTPASGISSAIITCSLWLQAEPIGWYNAQCDTLDIPALTLPSGASAAVALKAYPSSTVPMTPSSSDQTKPTLVNHQYMGSWPEDWGQGEVSGDYGTDFASSGISASAYADGTWGLINEFAQPLGSNRQYIAIQYTLSGLSSGAVTIPFPTMKASTQPKGLYYDHAQRGMLLFGSGPMFRWGSLTNWDSVHQLIVDWPLPQQYYLSPSALDAIGLVQNLAGIGCTDGLDTIVRTFYDYGIEYTQDKHLVSDPFSGAQLTHAFMRLASDNSTVCIALINSYSEVPPIGVMPEPIRNATTWAETPSSGVDGMAYSWSQGSRYIAEPGASTQSSLKTASGTAITIVNQTAPSGWWVGSFKIEPSSCTESGYKALRGSSEYMSLRPWRGWVWTGFPGAAAAAWGYDVSNRLLHVRTTVPSGSANFTVGRSGNAISWTDQDSGIAATWARPRFVDLNEELVGVVYGDGSNVYYNQTRNFGVNWLGQVSLGSGTVADFDEGANGLKWFYKVLSSDGGSTYDIWGQLRDNKMNIVRDWTITNLTGVDNQAIAVRESTDPARAWRIGILYSLSGAATLKFAKDGLTFS